MRRLWLILMAMLMLSGSANAGWQERLSHKIDRIAKGKGMTIGVAFAYDGKKYAYNDKERFPLASVMKYHVAVAALLQELPLDSLIDVQASDMRPDTYSPLRLLHPGADFRITLADLLRWSVSQSDNNANDLVIRQCGGIDRVEQIIGGLGIGDFELNYNESQQHDTPLRCYDNWTSPSAMTQLFMAYDHEILDQVLTQNTAGEDRIKSGLPNWAEMGHKTGTGPLLNGVRVAYNDAAVIKLPDGNRCYLAVFIKDSKETDETNSFVISFITKTIFDMFLREELK